jgi:hypothetical protein
MGGGRAGGGGEVERGMTGGVRERERDSERREGERNRKKK